MVAKGDEYFLFPAAWMWTRLSQVNQTSALAQNSTSKHNDMKMQAKWISSEIAIVELRAMDWWGRTGLPLTTALRCLGKDMWRAESSPLCLPR